MDKETKPQDIPAVEYYSSREITIEDIRKITKLMDDLNVIDTRDEIEIKEETKIGDIDFMHKWIREKSGK